MNNWLGLMSFIAFSVSGWIIFNRLKVPAASILGGLAFVIIANLLSIRIYMPSWLSFITSINVGISIGSKLNIEVDRKMIKCVILFAVTVIGGSLLIGFTVRALGIDAQTAMFSSLLGGLTEITYIAREFQFNAFQVSIFQTSRMCVLLIVVPVIARRISDSSPGTIVAAKNAATLDGVLDDSSSDKCISKPNKKPMYKKATTRDWIIIIILSAAAGYALSLLQVPAGKLIGASGVTALYSRFRNIRPKLNQKWHNTMLSFVGGSVGINVTIASLLQIPNLIIPIIVSLILIFFVMWISYWLIIKVAKKDKKSALFSSTLGGLTPSIAMAEEMGADSSIVSTFQVIRYFTVIALALVLGNII